MRSPSPPSSISSALFIFQLKVAATVGKGIVDPAIVDHYVIFGALMGALVWNIITWYYGMPSSSSHALIGGLIGAVVAKVGTVGLITSGISKTLIFIIVSPTLGFLLGGLLMLLVSRIFLPHPAVPRSTAGSGACSCFRPAITASATAPTTRRRPWASSGC
jgi:phosphate/sulfate permease